MPTRVKGCMAELPAARADLGGSTPGPGLVS